MNTKFTFAGSTEIASSANQENPSEMPILQIENEKPNWFDELKTLYHNYCPDLIN